MLRQTRGARRYTDRVVLTKAPVTVDEYGQRALGAAVPVLAVYAEVRRMSAQKTMVVFQQADVVGVEVEFRAVPGLDYNGAVWDGHELHFSEPEVIDNRGLIMLMTAYYQTDNPQAD